MRRMAETQNRTWAQGMLVDRRELLGCELGAFSVRSWLETA